MKNLFTIENSALLLIDHQVGTMNWVRSLDLDVIKTNTLVLAKSAQATGMPILLTSSMETQAQGLLFAELQQVLPDAYKDRIQREGQVDCMTDQNFRAAVEAMQRNNLIMAGITTDVCIVYPAITAVEAGYQVQVVVDACGSPTKLGDEIALRRMEKAGVILTTTNQLIAELGQNWSSVNGSKLIAILFEDILSKL
ncbi:isochorismatase family protein [Methyloglobulus sp.]|uniref:isochorismatase family protein n=1 Tax=Methyloglobulus sp. TaxID=2518622 RepID=UPI0032B7585C